MNKLFYCLLFSFLTLSTIAQKKSLSPDDLPSWERLSREQISNNGNWVTFQIAPYRGNQKLYLHNLNDSIEKVFSRAERANFSGSSEYLTFKLKLDYDSLRTLKIKKTKKNKMPKDTLGIYLFEKDTLLKFPKIKDVKVAPDNSSWLAASFEKGELIKKKKEDLSSKKKKKKKRKKKGTEINSAKKGKKKKYKTFDLLILNPITDKRHEFADISEFSISRNGKTIAFVTYSGDSIQSSGVYRFNTENEQIDTVFFSEGKAQKVTLNREGNHLTYLFSTDTAKVKTYSLHYANTSSKGSVIVDTNNAALPLGWTVSENGKIQFSKDSRQIWFGIAKRPEQEPKDSIPTDEKSNLDIWGYKDLTIMPYQLKRQKRDLKKTFKAVYHIADEKVIPLSDSIVDNVNWVYEGTSSIAIGYDQKPYRIGNTWEYPWGVDIYQINVKTGKRKKVLTNQRYSYSLSANGKYVAYFNPDDQNWYCINLQKKDTVNLTKTLTEAGQIFYRYDQEVPAKPGSLGSVGWSQNDVYFLVNSRYDIWQLDPLGIKKPVAITKGYADENKIKISYQWLDPDQYFIQLEKPLILKGQKEDNNEQSYFIRYRNSERFSSLISGDVRLSRLRKAKDAEEYIFKKESFYHEPQLHQLVKSNLNLEDRFKSNIQLSKYNAQKKEYHWGVSQPYFWKDEEGVDRKGLLFLPEFYEQVDSIPMVVYFYEKYFSSQNSHRSFRPSRSTISVPLYTSNGYAVFIPDITYGDGHPGKDANKAILSGVKALLKSHPFIDEKNIGLQGQSWGGYQTAILVTQTDFFKAAMAGAPVSNMTSAYGGIRWGSGLSRMFQYEQTQSRIGATLWERTDLYLENSPVFHANKISTPLLIMHNDNDGAVPWYQGIEMYMAMRRLGKPCWMLNYNGEEHNLTKLPNRFDLSKRMFQFFNHYLKGESAPKWMEKGIPAVEKGKDDGFELMKD